MSVNTTSVRNTTYHCGLLATLDVVSGRWKVLIIWNLEPQAKRFGELRRSLGKISEKMLTQQLKELESDGIVVRTDFKTVPPKVEYSLTDAGVQLKGLLEPLCHWGSEFMKVAAIAHEEGAPNKKRRNRQLN